MAKIVYLDAFPAANAHDILAERPDLDVVRITSDMPADQAFDVLVDAHAYQQIPARDEVPAALRVGADLLARCPNLLIASSNGSGVDTIDIEACTAAGVLVVNQAGGNAEAVAEHTLAMILSLLKRIGESDRLLRRGWTGARTDLLGRNLEGRTVGIIGIGHIGRRVAMIAKDVFGCRVLAYDPYVDAEETAARGAEKVGFDELLQRAEIVTIHCPLTAESEGMIGRDQLARMPDGALLISTARGGLIDEAALEGALRSGKVAGAGLDVWDKEPPPPAHPLLAFDTVIASPHTAGVTVDSRATMARYAATQLIDLFDGKPPARPLNPEVSKRYRKRFAAILGKMPDPF
ncbi:MAG: 3-phosphoglycerate dehydrogenase [Alphaproteobacteria bacterium]|nr:3-phosphoglycerate dehydrogenase [Alphaproteobacteria bacterium]